MGSDPEVLGDDAVGSVRRRRRSGDARPPREFGTGQLPPRWVWLITVVVIVAVGVGWLVDHRVAEHELRSIAGCDRALETASHVYDVRIDSTYDYLRPGLTGSSRRQAQLLGQMALPAREALPSARAAIARCERVHIVPWHTANRTRLHAAMAYSSALVARLEGLASKQQSFGVEDRHLARLRQAAGIRPSLEFM